MTLPLTPGQVEGPYYPVNYHHDEGNDLTANMLDTSAVELIYIAGHVRDTLGRALKHILIEIWQADHQGRYDHPGDENNPLALQPDFNYWGTSITDAQGFYYFKTIKPAAYNDDGDWRTPHVHFKLYQQRHQCLLTTQMYFVGEKLNAQDNHVGILEADKQALLLTEPRDTAKKFSLQSGIPVYEFNIAIDDSTYLD